MRRALILAAFAPLLMAQGIPRANCGFGEGLTQLRDVEREAGKPVPGLIEGRARGERAVASLNGAAATFRGCGCARLAELTAEASTVAASAPSESSAARLRAVFAQIRFRAQLARELSERVSCQ
ncbi:MAG: hypothetical protein JWR10_988 [Rubritepida sp.]|nr:hypothetical protein [Rubritepida sp.]